jgi:hypothetical protein
VQVETVEQKKERTPREEIILQAIGLAALLIAAALAPAVERWMSDPDIGFRMRWHFKRLQKLARMRMHETGMTVEAAIGLWQIEQALRNEWTKEHNVNEA